MSDDSQNVIEDFHKKTLEVNKNCAAFMPRDTVESYDDVSFGEGSVIVIYPNRLAGKDLPESLRQMSEVLKLQDKKTKKSSILRFWE